MILSFSGEHAFLSNFWYLPNGYTVEHLFQASKASSEEGRRWVLAAETPAEAKRRGRLVVLRDDWEELKYDLMLECLRRKFAPGSKLASMLLATGDELLVEGNTWHDTYWGQCHCRHHNGAGQNMLGLALMEIRSRLR